MLAKFPNVDLSHTDHQLLYSAKWCKRFSVGRESTEDDQRPLVTVSGVETVTKINQIVRADRRMSIRMIVEAVNADKETVRKILHEELPMTIVCAKLVSKNLTPDQKLLRQQVCSDFLERLKEDS
ncbi:putative mariner transposase [Trichonephila clavipes]|nr:putative mariner transposase [Trichonephila clavipes]